MELEVQGDRNLLKERLKILEVMNTITNKVGWKEFTEMVGMTPTQTVQVLHELMETGFVKKVEQGYSVTEKGKVALNALNRVPKGMEFHFYTEIDQYTGLSAESLQDFCELTRIVDSAALEFHITRGDFENWIKEIFRDPQLANKFALIKESKHTGEMLRTEILKATEQMYHELEESFSKS